MLRTRENPEAIKAAALSLTVHLLLLGALLVSFSWKNVHPLTVADVELWDSLPESVQRPLPEPIKPPEPVVQEVPKPEPPKLEPLVEPEPQPVVDIALERKKQLLAEQKEKVLEQKRKQEEALKELQQEMLEDPAPTRSQNDALKKLQQETLSEDKSTGEQKIQASRAAANASVIGEFTSKIKAKIRGHVNKTLCGEGNPELKFEIGLMPTGELSGNPKIVKSSGNVACDDAVERAIRASEPLPVPADATVFSQFRNLKLTFRPNES
ncbi:MAG: hypothetical protein FJY53_06730 [Betaproteobacteria bacterium]|nr:hypothetical protein [Betaproteobacteria bacterium]